MVSIFRAFSEVRLDEVLLDLELNDTGRLSALRELTSLTSQRGKTDGFQ